MQDGYMLLIGVSDTTSRPYYMIASTHDNGFGNTYFNATVFGNLLANGLIHQGRSNDYELTQKGEEIKL